MRIEPIKPFGARISDFSAADADETALEAFEAAFREHGLVVINDPALTADQQIGLLNRIGPVIAEMMGGSNIAYVANDPARPDASPVGRGELLFHCDMVWRDDWPFHAISLYAEQVPPSGGDTSFAHGGVALSRLSPELRSKVQDRRAVHIFDPYLSPNSPRMREAMMGRYAERAVHELVRPHPFGHGEVLTAPYANIDRVVGLTAEDGEALLQALFAAQYAPEAVYTHHWAVGDLVVWDNRVVQHARGDFDPAHARRMRRVSVGDEFQVQHNVRRWMEQLPVETSGRSEAASQSAPQVV